MDSARARERASRGRRVQTRKAAARRRDRDAGEGQALTIRFVIARSDETRRVLADAERFLRQITEP